MSYNFYSMSGFPAEVVVAMVFNRINNIGYYFVGLLNLIRIKFVIKI